MNCAPPTDILRPEWAEGSAVISRRYPLATAEGHDPMFTYTHARGRLKRRRCQIPSGGPRATLASLRMTYYETGC